LQAVLGLLLLVIVTFPPLHLAIVLHIRLKGWFDIPQQDRRQISLGELGSLGAYIYTDMKSYLIIIYVGATASVAARLASQTHAQSVRILTLISNTYNQPDEKLVLAMMFKDWMPIGQLSK